MSTEPVEKMEQLKPSGISGELTGRIEVEIYDNKHINICSSTGMAKRDREEWLVAMGEYLKRIWEKEER